MSTISTRRRVHGTVYRAEVWAKGRRVSRTFDRLSEAQRWAEDAEDRIRAGLPLEDDPPEGSATPFSSALDRYLKEVSGRKTRMTRTVEEYATRAMRDHFGQVPLAEIGTDAVATYRDMRLQKNGGQVLKSHFFILPPTTLLTVV